MSEYRASRILTDLFPDRERWRLAGVLAMGFTAAIFETLGVASVLPFMALVLDPAATERFPLLQTVASAFGMESRREALLFMGGVTVAMVTIGNAAGALNILLQERFAARTATRLSSALFAGYLRQPYQFHVHRDTASLAKVVVHDVRLSVMGVMVPLLFAASRCLIALGMLGLLLLHDPLVAIVVALVLGCAYATLFRVIRARQRRWGFEFNENNLMRQRICQEGLGAVKELQILGRERHAIERFAAATFGSAAAEASTRVVAHLPRYILEAVAFGGILLGTLLLVAGAEASAQSVLPVLALYAFAGMRLLPALQQAFASAANVRFHMNMLRDVHRDFVNVGAGASGEERAGAVPSPIAFADTLRLERVSFVYPNRELPAVREVDLEIRPNESIGLVGRTGSGKSTLADLILGVHEPTAGRITVDGVPLVGPAIRAWHRRVGYVAQHVFLANASVLENIGLGLGPDEIDLEAARKAATLAQADEFIDALPLGYATVVGERGVQLSGGQRQRIGIARALYHDPDILVFDEATGALDGLTEDAVMEAIRTLRRGRTIILIAHRLRTVEACDRIVMLEQGRVVVTGAYDDLMKSSHDFQRLVRGVRAGVAHIAPVLSAAGHTG